MFRDAGWEYIGEMSTWQYFRKEAKHEEINEIFTDVESKVAKYKRVLTYLGFFYIILFVIVISAQTIRVINPLILLFLTYAIDLPP